MADFGAPVAQNVNTGNGLQTLSSLMGLKQQQLQIAQQQIGLQQAQQQLSSKTSEATVAAINAKQQQALSQINPQQFVKPDGSYDTQGLTQAALTVAPNLGPDYVGRVEDMVQKGAAAKKAFFGLNQEYQEPIRAAFGTWGAPGSKGTPSDLAAQLQAIEEDAPAGTQQTISQITRNTLGLITGPDPVTGQPRSLQQQKAMALAYSRAGLTPSEVGGAGGIASPTPTALNTGGAIVPGSVAPAASGTPGAFTAQGAKVPTTLAPQIITQPGTGAPAAVGGAAGTNPRPLGAGSWWNPAPGQVQLLHANTAALAGRIQAGEQAANSSPAAIDALTRARSILDQGTWTGGTFSLTKDLSNLVAGLGVDTTTAQNASELAKNLARYEAARAGSVGSTDAARSLYEAGAPNTKMDANAVKAVVMQSLGIEKMIQGYAKAVGGAQTPQAAAQAEQQLRSIPNLVQTYELGFMRNPEEAQEFLKRYGLSAKEIVQSTQQLRQMGAL